MARHTFQEFFGRWPLQDLFAQDIDAIFVEPILTRRRNESESSEAQVESENFTALEAIKKESNLLLVAPIGMGKTLTLQHLALQILADPACQERGLVPVYMPLAALQACQSHQEKWKALEKHVLQIELQAKQHASKHDKWILLLDGLDEVDPDDRAPLIAFIQAAQTKVAKTLVATRPLMAATENSLLESFQDYDLLFDQPRQRALTQKLCDHETARQVNRYIEVFQISKAFQISHPHFPSSKDEDDTYLMRNENKTELLGYPLVLSLLCRKFNRASSQTEDGGHIDAFENQTELMAFLIRKLASFRPNAKKFQHSENPEHALELMRWLALWMRCQNKLDLDKSTLQEALDARYRLREAFPLNALESRWTKQTLNPSVCQGYLATLAQVTGLLIPTGNESYAFLKDTFAALLAAEFLTELTLEERLYFIQSKGLKLKQSDPNEAFDFDLSDDAPRQEEPFELVPPLPAQWRLGTVLNRNFDLEAIQALEWPDQDLPGIHFRRPPSDLKSVSLFPWMHLWDKKWHETLAYLVGLDSTLFPHLQAGTLDQVRQPIHSSDSDDDYEDCLMTYACEARQAGADYLLNQEYGSEYLEKVNTKYSMEPLLADLVDSDEDKQSSAIFILREFKHNIPTARLWQVLKAPEIYPETRVKLAAIMYESGYDNWLLAIEDLLDKTGYSDCFLFSLHWKSPRPFKPQAILDILRNPNEKRFLKELAVSSVFFINCDIRHDDYTRLSHYSLEDVAMMNSPEMYQALLDCLMDEQLDCEIRSNVLYSIAQFQTDSVTGHLLDCMNKESTPAELSEDIAKVLARKREPIGFERLVAMINDTQNTVDFRINIMHELDWISFDTCIEDFIRFLQDPELEIRLNATYLLTKSRNFEAFKCVQSYLLDLREGAKIQDELKAELMAHLEKIEDWGNIDFYVPMLLEWFQASVGDDDFRKAYLRVVSRFKTKEVVETLLTCLQDSDDTIRSIAVYWLGERNHKEAIEPIMHLLRDPDQDVREEAVDALIKLDTQSLSLFAKLLVFCQSGQMPELTWSKFWSKFWSRLSVEEVAVLFEPEHP